MSIRVIQGDVRDQLPKLPANSFDCIVTSPPYYGLRDYGCAGQIGLEPTLDAYLETIVMVCRELRRVLKPSGVFFLNIGDSYNGGGLGGGGGGNLTKPNANRNNQGFSRATLKVRGLKPKDLCLVPERLGIALQNDGWWVRSHIIWAKQNCMPESVTDRPTSAHETIWLLTKSERYFWDGDAVKEEAITAGDTLRITGDQSTASGVKIHGNQLPENYNNKIRASTRNIRNVWSFASQPFPGAHFATFPPELVERCIKAGSSEHGCCRACGAPWVRVVAKESYSSRPNSGGIRGSAANHFRGIGAPQRGNMYSVSKILGCQPSCKCYVSDPIPARILDPFAGSGTTGLVADRLGRDCTLIDLNTEYIDMAADRIRDDSPLFAEVAAE